jgi:hypothetical protein
MSETTASDRSGGVDPPKGRFLRNAWGVITLVLVIASYTLGWEGGVRETTNQFKAENSRLQSDNQRLSKDNASEAAQIANMQAQLRNAQSQLAAVTGPAATFEITPNESMVVAGSHLTIGLVGAPTNDKVNINVNGKQQSAAAGDVINVALSASCRVEVKSFEMFKAVVTTTCAEARP